MNGDPRQRCLFGEPNAFRLRFSIRVKRPVRDSEVVSSRAVKEGELPQLSHRFKGEM
jgi:hypothetical protein